MQIGARRIRPAQHQQHFSHQGLHVYGVALQCCPACTREIKQTLEQLSHLVAAVLDALEETHRVWRER